MGDEEEGGHVVSYWQVYDEVINYQIYLFLTDPDLSVPCFMLPAEFITKALGVKTLGML